MGIEFASFGWGLSLLHLDLRSVLVGVVFGGGLGSFGDGLGLGWAVLCYGFLCQYLLFAHQTAYQSGAPPRPALQSRAPEPRTKAEAAKTCFASIPTL